MIIHGFKKQSQQEAEEKVQDILSFLDKETDPVKIDFVGTTNEQNRQLLPVKLQNSKTKWELNRSSKKLREDIGRDGI